MSILSISFLVHSNGTSSSPPGHIFTDHASTRGMPDVESGNSITVEPLDRIIFCVPSRVHITPTKFLAVKSVPNILGQIMCLQAINVCVNGALLIVKVQVICPRAPMSSPVAVFTNGLVAFIQVLAQGYIGRVVDQTATCTCIIKSIVMFVVKFYWKCSTSFLTQCNGKTIYFSRC